MKVLTVYDHPRRDSFCGAVLAALHDGLREAGHEVESADLHAENFDPRMTPADEPDWSNPAKAYSPAVLAEQNRIERNDALILVFPVWWWSLPAMTKGWVDRVWNNGWAYGPQKLTAGKARLIGVAASDAPHYAKRGYDKAMEVQLVTGILSYCGIEDAGMELLHGSLGDDRTALLARARVIGREF